MNRTFRFFSVLLTAVFLSVFILSLLISLSACDQTSYFYLSAFNTDVYIETSDFSASKSEKSQIAELLKTLDDGFSTGNERSWVSRFNSLSVGESIDVGETEKKILSLCREYAEFSGDKFTPTTYPLSKLWGFAEGYKTEPLSFIPPSSSAIETTLKDYSFDISSLLPVQNSLTKSNNVELDFGGVLKGYASDKIAEILLNNGHESGYVSVGGSSLYLLSTDSLSIVHPTRPQENIITLGKLKNLSVSTSGVYRNYYLYQGKSYSHILSVVDGYPTDTGVLSSVIVGNNGAFLDAVSTALCLCEFDANSPESSELYVFIQKLIKSEYGVKSVFALFDDGIVKRVITNEKQGSFSLLDKSYSVVTVSLP